MRARGGGRPAAGRALRCAAARSGPAAGCGRAARREREGRSCEGRRRVGGSEGGCGSDICGSAGAAVSVPDPAKALRAAAPGGISAGVPREDASAGPAAIAAVSCGRALSIPAGRGCAGSCSFAWPGPQAEPCAWLVAEDVVSCGSEPAQRWDEQPGPRAPSVGPCRAAGAVPALPVPRRSCPHPVCQWGEAGG